MQKKNLRALIFSLRPNQWVKNLILFAAIIFTGKLFEPNLFFLSFLGFLIFSALSSASYLFNDIIDLKFDRKHQEKRLRPLAAGQITLEQAGEMAFLLFFFGLIGALFLSLSFFLVATVFALLHLLYSLILKKYAIFDILAIAFSFILRSYAGEVLTGYHLPFWLFLTIFFMALFIASTKRHAELLSKGTLTRPALFEYKEHVLDIYTSIFGAATILAYALFTFIEEPPQFNAPFKSFLLRFLPQALERKWMIITIPMIIFGLMRYAQLAYQSKAGETPEKIITTDIPLITSILLWGITIILILYIL